MLTKEPGVFRLASVSDVHTGHAGTPSELILQNLERAFPMSVETGKLDLIVIVGDFFDRLLNLPDDNVSLIKRYIYSLLWLCKRLDIVLVVLEGTRTHDWCQNRLWPEMNELGGIGAELYYVDTLSVLHIDRFNLDFLCVPDDWNPEPDDTWKEVQQLLQAKGLEKVDYSLIHGSFAHQLPEFVAAPKHLGERYLDITRYYILVGHVHQSSVYRGRLLANGSFDRLTHGEEGPKGHWRLAVGKPGGDEILFVENTGAKIYKTYDCTGMETDAALSLLDEVATLPEGSAIRIIANKSDPIFASLDLLRKTYPLLQWSTKIAKSEETQRNLLTDMRVNHREIAITKDNLFDLMMTRLRHLTQDERVLARCAQRLQERIEE